MMPTGLSSKPAEDGRRSFTSSGLSFVAEKVKIHLTLFDTNSETFLRSAKRCVIFRPPQLAERGEILMYFVIRTKFTKALKLGSQCDHDVLELLFRFAVDPAPALRQGKV